MCTQTENIEVVEEPRTLNELLILETYQGMTDEEIDMIINYKIEHALLEDEQQAKRDAISEQVNDMKEVNIAAHTIASTVLQSLLDNGVPVVKSPEMKIFEPRILEV